MFQVAEEIPCSFECQTCRSAPSMVLALATASAWHESRLCQDFFRKDRSMKMDEAIPSDPSIMGGVKREIRMTCTVCIRILYNYNILYISYILNIILYIYVYAFIIQNHTASIQHLYNTSCRKPFPCAASRILRHLLHAQHIGATAQRHRGGPVFSMTHRRVERTWNHNSRNFQSPIVFCFKHPVIYRQGIQNTRGEWDFRHLWRQML